MIRKAKKGDVITSKIKIESLNIDKDEILVFASKGKGQDIGWVSLMTGSAYTATDIKDNWKQFKSLKRIEVLTKRRKHVKD